MQKESWEYILILVVTSLFVAFILSYVIRKFLTLLINKKSKRLKINPTNFIFIKNSIQFVVYSITIFWIFMKIPSLSTLGRALFTGAGVLAAILGFASQKAFSNIIGGLFILFFKPFRVTDIIKIGDGVEGEVEDITLRHTIIKDFEFKRIVIPNSIISEETIINHDIIDKKIQKHIFIDISYDSNIDKAMTIIKDKIINHPLFLDRRSKKEKEGNISPIKIRVVTLDNYSVKIRAEAWTRNFYDSFNLKCDVLKSIKEAFDENGIEIPAPYRTIVMKRPSYNVKNK